MSKSISVEDCKQWISQPTINPQTGRKIKPGCRLYLKYKGLCKKLGLVPPEHVVRDTVCNKRWMPLVDPKATTDYGVRAWIPCDTCDSYKTAFAIHREDSLEYECVDCGEYIDIRYLCIQCRRRVP